MKIETIREQCGSKTARTLDFKKKLILALELLIKNNDIKSYSISKDGLVQIQRKES